MAKPTILWRLEDAYGVGVYNANSPDGNPILPDRSPYREGNGFPRPGPARDPMPNGKGNLGDKDWPTYWDHMTGTGPRFAFATLAQARTWFDKAADVREWSLDGLKLTAYDAHPMRKVFVACYQAMFRTPVVAHEHLHDVRHASRPAADLCDMSDADLLAWAKLELNQ